MGVLKFFLSIIKDERGGWFWPLVGNVLGSAASSAVSGAMSGGGGGGGGGGGRFGPITGIGTAENLEQWIQHNLQKPATAYSGQLTSTQPGIEGAAESTILGRLSNLPQSQDYRAKVEASKNQQISREKERAQTQLDDERNMYNRLGLVSSTPWLGRAGELGDESLMRQKDIETGMDVYGLNYGLQSDALMDQIARGWTNAGSVLGAQQRGYQYQDIANQYNDFLRTTPENSPWLDRGMQLLGLLGGGGNEGAEQQQPGGLSGLSGGFGNLGSMALLQSILGQGGGGGSAAAGGSGSGFGLLNNPNMLNQLYSYNFGG